MILRKVFSETEVGTMAMMPGRKYIPHNGMLESRLHSQRQLPADVGSGRQPRWLQDLGSAPDGGSGSRLLPGLALALADIFGSKAVDVIAVSPTSKYIKKNFFKAHVFTKLCSNR